jgi:hypothetical protein
LFFNRSVVSRHIITAFREALLAGFPPEAITSHQIPDFGTVGAVRRITPIDVVLSAGAGFGLTSYGLFYNRPGTNFLEGAHSSGHHNITFGEYHSRTSSQSQSRNQFDHIMEHGGKYTHICCAGTEETFAAEYAVTEQLKKDNPRRPGLVGGTGQLRPIEYSTGDGTRRYDVVQLGHDPTAERNGLLKSVDEDGNWEGTVYLVPFHASVAVDAVVENAEVTIGSETTEFSLAEAINDDVRWSFQHNDQVEIRFDAPDGGADQVILDVYADGASEPFETHQFGDATDSAYRYVLHNQLPIEDVRFVFRSSEESTVTLQNVSIIAQRRRTARKYFEQPRGEPHAGGVRFDIWQDPIPREAIGD